MLMRFREVCVDSLYSLPSPQKEEAPSARLLLSTTSVHLAFL
jgi:hypothetical protein